MGVGRPPRAAKLELYLKFWGGKNYFEAGEKFYGRGGDYSENGGNRRRSEIFQTSKTKVVKNLWAIGKKSREVRQV